MLAHDEAAFNSDTERKILPVWPEAAPIPLDFGVS